MQALDKLSAHLRTRARDIAKLRGEGGKVVAYTPGGYMPEELVLACGALPVPVGLTRGGEHEPVLTAGAYLTRWLDTFCRAQIGYRALGDEPLYQMIDLLVVPITDNNIRAIADSFSFYTDVDVFPFGVPHTKTEHGFAYYLEGINMLKEKLENLTGVKITDDKLQQAIDLCNRERGLLKELSLTRKLDPSPITEREFITLNHASFLADKNVMVEVLEEFCDEVKKRVPPPAKGPRILLTGSTLAVGDYKVLDLIDEAGGVAVIEEFVEGVRHYWETVKPDGNLMEALANRYFMRRVPGAWARPANERRDFVLKLAKEFSVNGVIWYQLMYRDSYDLESEWFPEVLKRETGLSMLKIESDYDVSEMGPFSTRIETYIETIKG
jgi:benzoyl-CoA reductase/2-hydroxyglutaryl-CoA dehydratase subunit BcrC/BadD/HgdB